MRKKYKKVIVLVLLIYCFLDVFVIPSSVAFAQDENKKVLIMNSYHKDYKWTSEVEQGIIDTLENIDFNITFHREYMDSKVINTSKYLKHLYEIYKEKYRDKKYDLIVSTDDEALNFLLDYGDELFPNTPVVFSGVNVFQDSMLEGKELFTGIVEIVDIRGTIDLGLRLHPNTKQVIIINDKTIRGLEQRKIIMDILSYYNKIALVILEEESISKLENTLKEYKENTIILNISTSFKNDDGEIINTMEGLKEISRITNLPIYTLWNTSIGDGVVGGRVIKGCRHGKRAGEIGVEILQGKKPSNIPVGKENFYTYIFDHEALEKFHIERRMLPKESSIINRPSYTLSKDIVYSLIVVIIMVLLIIIFFLFESVLKRRIAEKELRKSKERYRKLVELCPDAIAVHNSQGKIVYANPAAIKMMEGKNKQDIMGKSVINFVGEDYKEEVLKGIQELINNKESVFPPREQKIYTLKGKTLYLEIVGCPISYTSDSDILVIARDISERKRVEKLKRKIQREKILLDEAREYEQLKIEFFANLSHEFRTPLNVILGSIQLLYMDIKDIKDQTLVHRFNKRIKALKQNCYRLIRIVNNLIDITRIDANYYELNLENHNIVSIIEDITLSVADYIEQRDIKLIFDTEIEEKVIACDPDKIERIILNILSNSLKFTNAGGEIIVNILDREEEVCISITDTGIGIKDDKKEIIFDRFRQADKSFTRNHEGSGIGLSLVKSLVEMHEGRIYVNSEYGKGCEFVICLPVKTIDDSRNQDTKLKREKNHIELIDIEFSDIYE